MMTPDSGLLFWATLYNLNIFRGDTPSVPIVPVWRNDHWPRSPSHPTDSGLLNPSKQNANTHH